MNDTLSVMFLNLDMKRRRTGIENAALMRARMFERELGIIPSILTVSYDPHFAETRNELLRSGFITDNLVFRNLYDWFQEMDAATPLAETSSESSAVAETVLNDEWKVASVAGTPDSRIYDADGTCLMYRKCSRDWRSGSIQR